MNPRFWILAALLLIIPPQVSAEPSISFQNIRVYREWLEIDFQLLEGFSDNVRETLERGLPATVQFEIELWRDRSRWYDHLEETRFLTFHIEYDRWEKTWEVRGPFRDPLHYTTFDKMASAVLRQERVRIADMGRLRVREPYYFSVRAEVKPLELEQIREIEAWLEGKIPGENPERDADAGLLRLIPERLFGFAASVAGLGAKSIEAKSITFQPGALR